MRSTRDISLQLQRGSSQEETNSSSNTNSNKTSNNGGEIIEEEIEDYDPLQHEMQVRFNDQTGIDDYGGVSSNNNSDKAGGAGGGMNAQSIEARDAMIRQEVENRLHQLEGMVSEYVVKKRKNNNSIIFVIVLLLV